VCSIRIFAKNMGDPYYEPTIVVHDNKGCEMLKLRYQQSLRLSTVVT